MMVGAMPKNGARRTPDRLLRAVCMAAATLALVLPPAAAPPALAATGGWPTYHLDNTRQGDDTGEPAFAVHAASGDWTNNALDGDVFASPVVYNGVVYVATENNTVYALNETSGTEAIPHDHLATATPATTAYLGCGNVTPTVGITSTPVIDAANNVIYVVGEVPVSSTASEYRLWALSLTTLALIRSTPIVLAGLNPRYQGQRSALAFGNGYVYIAFGGRDGDCGTYHPWVVGVQGVGYGTAMVTYQPQTASQNEAGLWAASGIAMDGSGNLYVETGNGAYSTSTPCDNANWDHGDSVIKLSPALVQLDFFAPQDWCALNAADSDLGSIGPMLVGGSVLASGKSGSAWLLSQSALGGFGGAGTSAASAHIPGCQTSDAVFGGMAYAAPFAYVPCDGYGLVALNLDTAHNTWTVGWNSVSAGTAAFSPGAPIVAGGIVWDEPQFGGSVLGFDPSSGTRRYDIALSAGAHRFTTLAADGGRLFAMLDHGIESLDFTTFTVAYTAYFTWYDRVSSPGFVNDNVHVVNPGGSAVFVNVSIPGSPACVFSGDVVAAGAEHIYTCATGFGGPVRVQASARVIASQRTQFYQSFNEVPAEAGPGAQDLWLSWFDRVSDPGFQVDNVHVVNLGAATANVSVGIPGYPGCNPSQAIPVGGEASFTCATGFGGPVHVHSDQNVLASQRVRYNQTFNEVWAQPAASAMTLDSMWYDRASSPLFEADNVHVMVTSGTLSPGQVTIAVPGCSPTAWQASPAELVYACPPGTGYGGPVTLQSAVPILASQRVRYSASFNEAPAFDPAAASTSLWMPWFDHLTAGFNADNLHVLNPAGALSPGQVSVQIPGCAPAVAQLSPGELLYSCPAGTGFGGPVHISSPLNLLASQRVSFYSSFNESAAMP